MGKYVAENLVKSLIKAGKPVRDAKVAILGFTFKENCPDTRNSKVFDIVKELREYSIEPIVADPVADSDEAEKLYGIKFTDVSEIKEMDGVILAVAHVEFGNITLDEMNKICAGNPKVLLDIKGILNRKEYEKAGYCYWRL